MPLKSFDSEPITSSERLKKAMEDYGYSAAEVAQTAKVSGALIHFILSGKRSVSARTAKALAQAFGRTEAYWKGEQE